MRGLYLLTTVICVTPKWVSLGASLRIYVHSDLMQNSHTLKSILPSIQPKIVLETADC